MISGSGHYQGHDLEDLVSISEGPKWVGAVKPNVLHLMHIHGRPFSSTSQALSEQVSLFLQSNQWSSNQRKLLVDFARFKQTGS